MLCATVLESRHLLYLVQFIGIREFNIFAVAGLGNLQCYHTCLVLVCYVQFVRITAFIIVGAVYGIVTFVLVAVAGLGELHCYDMEMLRCYAQFVRIRAFFIVAFAGCVNLQYMLEMVI
jgi:hypothetical protein